MVPGLLSQIYQAQTEQALRDEPNTVASAQIAVVAGIDDEKIEEGEKRARVKVRLINYEDQVHWCEVMGFGVRSEKGWQLPLKVGDEVLIVPHGANQFVIVGAVWTGERSKKVPKDVGEEEHLIATPDETVSLRLKKDQLVIETGKNTVTLDDNGITVDARNIYLGAPAGKVGIHAQTLSISGKKNVYLQAGSVMHLHGEDTAMITKVTAPGVGLAFATDTVTEKAPAAPKAIADDPAPGEEV